MKNLLLRSLCLALGLSVPCVFAQQQEAEDLKFPDKPSEFSFFRGPQLSLYKPEGAGPFPALVLVHPCSGLGVVGKIKPNTTMLQWAKDAVARGYVVLLMDSLGPRGVDSVCYGVQGGVGAFRGLKDSLQAAQHLQKFDFVDKNRIALAGYSWGAGIGLRASSASYSSKVVPGVRFSAAISFYPGCFTKDFKGEPITNLAIRPDIDRPLLVLMGDLDNETPPEECVEQLSPIKAAGAPVEWHVYPKTTHCWDCRHLDGQFKTDVRGNRVTYRYSREVTEDSARRMFQFLDKVMSARP